MAIIKPIEIKQRKTVSYWRRVHTEIIDDQRRMIVLWSGYLDDEDRAGGGACEVQRSESITIDDAFLAALYTLMQPLSEFADGEPYITDPWKVPVQETQEEPTIPEEES